ncbi:MAG: acetyl ornithine aminotransferase family protein [Deltaproteobacteria bacterium]|nr:MAG: acetyl ornithine aminotransferase family protein [Deltaproteobacteria bacterium]
MARACPRIVTELPGPKAKRILEIDRRYVSPSYTRDYPLVVERAEGMVIEDPDGNRFLDFAAGIAVTATGHCHPKVVAAITEQASRLIHMSGTDFYYAPQALLAEKLARIAPGENEKRVFFCNSGTEAVEAGIKLARYHTGRKAIIGFYGAFHGRTLGALSLTASKTVQRNRFLPLLPGTFHAPYAYCYRCPVNRRPETCAIECADFIEETLFKHTLPPQEVAAIIVEPIQGEGGYVVPPAGFLEKLTAVARKHDILLIADEVQSGMGRTGKMFASEHFGFQPDILLTAKGIASGMPLGAVIARKEVMDWKPGAHASTFGGNPVSCAAALATIELLESGLIENAATMGAHLMERLGALQARHPAIGQVRGKGLMVGAELVTDREARTRASKLRNDLVMAAFQRGLLLLGCGENTVRFAPPLIVTREEIDQAVEIFEEALAGLTS